MKTSELPALGWRLLRVQILNELQYRANFFVQLLQSVLSIGISLVVVGLVFAQIHDLNGWTKPQLMAFVGVFTLVGGVLRMFVRPMLERLVRDVQDGTLDFVLVRPMDAQFVVSTRAVDAWQGVDVLAGLAVIGWAVIGLRPMVGPVEVLLFLVTLVFGLLIIYCFLFCLMSTVFWFVRVDGIAEMFESVYQAGRWPLTIYPGWLRVSLTFVVPIGFSISLPAAAIAHRLSGAAVLGEALAACALALVTRYVFTTALRHYSGASA
ncbi:ABC transporter permease [Cryptosporangium sp. NPDC051539]|uniref:ABC transporter permease n=1 Tax=Cryptosporangium sp. NPDC051539 TaxID=3363962 RepID=UPI0037AE0D1C